VFRIVSAASLRDAAKTTRLDCGNSQSSRTVNQPKLKIVVIRSHRFHRSEAEVETMAVRGAVWRPEPTREKQGSGARNDLARILIGGFGSRDI